MRDDPQPRDWDASHDPQQSSPGPYRIPGTSAPPRSGITPEPRRRVGFWLGVLLVFVPVFYPLLYFRPFSWVARIGWGLWLGFIVFVKVSGLSEPVINLSEIESELRRAEQQAAQPDAASQAAPAPGLAETFVEREDAPSAPPPLDDYLRELGGGLLGRRIDSFSVEGTEGAPDASIHIVFLPADFYLKSETDLAAESLGMALSLCYGRDFRAVTLDFVLNERPVRVQATRAGLADFLGLDEAALSEALTTREGQESLGLRELSKERLGEFYRRFAEAR